MTQRTGFFEESFSKFSSDSGKKARFNAPLHNELDVMLVYVCNASSKELMNVIMKELTVLYHIRFILSWEIDDGVTVYFKINMIRALMWLAF